MSKDKCQEAKVKEEVRETDIMLWAIPKENRAELEAKTNQGKIFMSDKFGVGVKLATIPAEAINPLLAKIRENNLVGSFRLKA